MIGKLGRHPLGWLAVGIVGVGPVSVVVSAGPVFALLGAAAAVAVYWAVMRFVARRPAPEVARAGAGREALRGACVGAGFVLVSVLVIAGFGGYSIRWADDAGLGVVLSVVFVSVGAAVTEELLFRGLALQAIEALAGSRVGRVARRAARPLLASKGQRRGQGESPEQRLLLLGELVVGGQGTADRVSGE